MRLRPRAELREHGGFRGPAVACIRPGSACSSAQLWQPQALVRALRITPGTGDVEIVLWSPWASRPVCTGSSRSTFASTLLPRDAVETEIQPHWADYTPIFLSDIPELFRSGRLPLDVALIQVTEPNEHGFARWASR